MILSFEKERRALLAKRPRPHRSFSSRPVSWWSAWRRTRS